MNSGLERIDPPGRWVTLQQRRFFWPRLAWHAEAATLLAAYGLYSVTRVLVAFPGRTQEAMRHASEVIRLEQLLGVCDELGLNQLLTGREWLEFPASYFYSSLHFLVTPAVLGWLWRTRPELYGPLRSGLVLMTLSGLAVFAAWPLAPPRYALSGTSDTVLRHPAFWASAHVVSGFFNQFAAMPSLHVAWALWCAVALLSGTSSSWRQLVWLYPAGTVLVVLGTANHYLLDVAGGAVACASSLSITTDPSHRRRPVDDSPSDARVHR
jgi:hypothetical protein